jgi:hypothetical protein
LLPDTPIESLLGNLLSFWANVDFANNMTLLQYRTRLGQLLQYRYLSLAHLSCIYSLPPPQIIHPYPFTLYFVLPFLFPDFYQQISPTLGGLFFHIHTYSMYSIPEHFCAGNNIPYSFVHIIKM